MASVTQQALTMINAAAGAASDVITNKKLVWDARYGVTAGGFNNISAIIDQSGNGNNFTGHLGPNDFSWTATGFDGTRPAFTMPAGEPALGQCSPFALGTGNTLTICVVSRIQPTSNIGTDHGRLVSYVAPGRSADNTDLDSFALTKLAFGNDTDMEFNRNGVTNNLSGTFTTRFILIVTVSSGGTITYYLNGTKSVGSNTVSGNWASGGSFAVGGMALGGNYWPGLAGQIIISTDCIDDATAAAYYALAKTEWGL